MRDAVFGDSLLGWFQVLTLPLRGNLLKCRITRTTINSFPDGSSSRA
jgi:hypothetical protein